MSIGQTFPDAVVLLDGWIRLITEDARSWAFMNTDLSEQCDKNNIPYTMQAEDNVPSLMEEDGLVVRRKYRYG